MTKQKTFASLAVAVALSLASLGPLATVSLAQQNDQPVYGSQMMTDQERMEYRNKMMNAKTEQEREQIRAEHHVQMQERAKERGITLPENPPADKGMGSGMGTGKGMGTGSGMGTGKGMGSGSGMGTGKGMKKGGGG